MFVDRVIAPPLVLSIVLVDARVALEVVLLPFRELHHLQAGEVLLQVLVETRDRQAHQAKQMTRGAAEVVSHRAHDRQRGQEHQRELHVNGEHDGERDKKRHKLADQRAHAA